MMFDFDDLPEEEFAPAFASAVETNGEHPKNSSDDGEDVVAEPYSEAGEDVGAEPPSEAEPKRRKKDTPQDSLVEEGGEEKTKAEPAVVEAEPLACLLYTSPSPRD